MEDNTTCACYCSCPFQCILDYTMRIPDPFGIANETLRLIHPSEPKLKFMRARTTMGDRRFISSNLGINKLREILPRINDKLPQQLQCPNIRGHSGRRTFVTTAVNNGVDSQIIAKASHHKDVNSISKYIDPDVKSIASVSLTCAKAAAVCGGSSSSNNTTPLKKKRSFEEDDEYEKENFDPEGHDVRRRLVKRRKIHEDDEDDPDRADDGTSDDEHYFQTLSSSKPKSHGRKTIIINLC